MTKLRLVERTVLCSRSGSAALVRAALANYAVSFNFCAIQSFQRHMSCPREDRHRPGSMQRAADNWSLQDCKLKPSEKHMHPSEGKISKDGPFREQ
jgi:hypothetical protein